MVFVNYEFTPYPLEIPNRYLSVSYWRLLIDGVESWICWEKDEE